MGSTNFCFKPGKLTTLMDFSAGSSGKARTASFIAANADNFTFACNAFSAQAGHTVKLEDGRVFFYQSLNSCAYQHERLEKFYIGPGAAIELPALLREINENGIPDHKLGIHPNVVIIQDKDSAFERGECHLDGTRKDVLGSGTMKSGSTCHGVGAANARRMLRQPDIRTAKDQPELQKYLCDVSSEIVDRLNAGESGFLEIAQGWALSLNGRFFPHCTSRNCSVAQSFSDLMLPIKFAGPLIMNGRTWPIRISSFKYVAEDGRHLTWEEVKSGTSHTVVDADSGSWYPDQEEVTWEYVTKYAGSSTDLTSLTSVTKLPRRVATFSTENLLEAMRYNDTGDDVWLALNFIDHIDSSCSGARSSGELSPKVYNWFAKHGIKPKFLGTSAMTEDTVIL